jgi:hypothetical protein
MKNWGTILPNSVLKLVVIGKKFMGKAYKNFWSLNTDEAVVVGILRDITPKNIEVLMPVNAQMKDIDLVLMNLKNKKSLTVQVKGSRAYEPRKSEVIRHVTGSAGWFMINFDTIFKNTADYFIFLIYVLEEDKKAGRRIISHHTITIPTKELQLLTKRLKKFGKTRKYNFLIWIDPFKKIAFDVKDKRFDLSEYLDKKGFERLNKKLI